MSLRLYKTEWQPYCGIPAEDELAAIVRDEVLLDLNDRKDWRDEGDNRFHLLYLVCRLLVEKIKDRIKSS